MDFDSQNYQNFHSQPIEVDEMEETNEEQSSITITSSFTITKEHGHLGLQSEGAMDTSMESSTSEDSDIEIINDYENLEVRLRKKVNNPPHRFQIKAEVEEIVVEEDPCPNEEVCDERQVADDIGEGADMINRASIDFEIRNEEVVVGVGHDEMDNGDRVDVANGESEVDNAELGHHQSRSSDGENRGGVTPTQSDQQPVLADPEPESLHQPIALIPQLCTFCARTFNTEKELSIHLDECNHLIKKIVNVERKQCLICFRRITSFALCGVIRHAISCIINEREGRLRREAEEGEIQNLRDFQPKTEVDNRNDRSPVPPSDPRLSKGQLNRRFTYEQRSILLNYFKIQKFPSFEEKEMLSQESGLSTAQVQAWFERHRFRVGWAGYTKPYRKTRRAPAPAPIMKETRTRSGYPIEIKQALIACYTRTMFPSDSQVVNLAQKTHLSIKQVRDWFSSQRRRPHSKYYMTYGTTNESKSQSQPGRSHFQKIKPESVKSLKLGELSNSMIAEFKEVFRTNQTPSVVDIISLAQRTGTTTRTVQRWFNNERRLHKQRPKIETSDNEDTESDAEDDTETEGPDASKYNLRNRKCHGFRQKLAAIRKASEQEINEILQKTRDLAVRLLQWYASVPEEIQAELGNESGHLKTAFFFCDPFTEFQAEKISDWEEDFAVGMYPDRDDSDWRRLVNMFRTKLLHVWLRVIIYSRVVNISICEAALEIHQLTLGRNEKPAINDIWKIPQCLDEWSMELCP